MTMNCLFCKIAKKEIDSEVVYEDADTVAVLDIHPQTPGHTMVLPKTHAANILDLSDNLIGPVFGGVKNVTRLLEKTLKPDGFIIGINHGAVSGQSIAHLHIHIMPRWRGDGGSSIHSVVKNPPEESLKEIKEKIVRGDGS